MGTNRDVNIPWEELNTFNGVLDARRFYEAVLPTISQLHRQAAASQSRPNELRTLRQHIGAFRSESVCDLGCGLGDWAYVYGSAAKRILLVDVSPSILARAMKRMNYWATTSDVTFQVFDLFNETDWRNLAGFRMYLLAFVLGHADEPQRISTLASLRSIVRSGDRVVVIDSLKSAYRQEADTVRCVDIDGSLVGAIKHFFDREEVIDAIRHAGFEVTSSYWGSRYFFVEMR